MKRSIGSVSAVQQPIYSNAAIILLPGCVRHAVQCLRQSLRAFGLAAAAIAALAFVTAAPPAMAGIWQRETGYWHVDSNWDIPPSDTKGAVFKVTNWYTVFCDINQYANCDDLVVEGNKNRSSAKHLTTHLCSEGGPNNLHCKDSIWVHLNSTLYLRDQLHLDGDAAWIGHYTDNDPGLGVPGYLYVQTGSSLDVGGDVNITAYGQAYVRNSGSSITSDQLIMEAGGQLSVSGGGIVDLETNAFMGSDSNTTTDASISISGTGSVFDCSLLQIAGDYDQLDNAGGGLVEVNSGGRLAANSYLSVGVEGPGSGRLIVGADGEVDTPILRIGDDTAMADGTVTVNGGSVDANDIKFGRGNGRLLINGGTVNAVRMRNIHGLVNGEVTLDGGTLTVGTQLELSDLSSFSFKSGTLRADSVSGNLTVGDGSGNGDAIHAPYWLDEMQDNYTLQSDAQLAIELGIGANDWVQVNGDAYLDGLLSVSEYGGFTLQPNQNFEIVDVDGDLHGTFSGLVEGALVGNYSGTDLFITYLGGDGNDVILYTPSYLLWDEPAGGLFGLSGNWSPERIPGSNDTAMFNLGSVAGYDVAFDGNATNQRLIVRNDVTTLNLAGYTYSLTSPVSESPSIVVGQSPGDVADFTISGGTLESVHAQIGRDASSDGTVTIDGDDSLWSNSQSLHIGLNGGGTLDVTGGGSVSTGGTAYLGANAGSEGTATVSGADSLWTIDGLLSVGDGGGSGNPAVGTVNIQAGAELTTTTAKLGDGVLGSGTVTLTGDGSEWDVAESLYVGESGEGILNVSDRAALTVGTDLKMAEFASGDGDVLIENPGTIVDVTDRLWVGFNGDAELTVRDGATLTSNRSWIGQQTNSIGRVTVEDGGSSWTTATQLYVGGSTTPGGTGTLTVQNDGYVEVGDVLQVWGDGTVELLGSQILTHSFIMDTGATFTHDAGTLTVDGGTFEPGPGTPNYTIDGPGNPTLVLTGGASSSLGMLTVADNQTGTLIVEDTATLDNLSGVVGDEENAAGDVNLTGAGSQWNVTEDLYVGRLGTGNLDVAAGAELTVGTHLYVADQGTAVGDVAFEGAGTSVAVATRIHVGHRGDGTMAVRDGATVTCDRAYIGHQLDSIGAVTVEDAGSSWIADGEIYVGGSTTQGGTGTLTVQTGGYVEVGGMLKIWDTATVNLNSGGEIAAEWVNIITPSDLVMAADATLRANGLVGFGNNATFAGHVTIGHGRGTASGDHTITAGQTMTVDGTLTVGYSDGPAGASGTIIVSNGGLLDSGDSYLGHSTAGNHNGWGYATVTGAGATWTAGDLYLGYGDGSGQAATITVSNGGTLETADGYIGHESDCDAIVTIDGEDSSWTAGGSIHVANSIAGPGTKRLTVRNGGTVNAADTIYVHSNGIVELLGSEIHTGSFTKYAPATFTHEDGTLIVDGGSLGGIAPGINGAEADDLPTIRLINGASAWFGGDFTVGNTRKGRLEILSGSTFDNGDSYVGREAGSEGTVLVDGDDSVWDVHHANIGNHGTGTVTVSGDGQVYASTGTTLGVEPNSHGTIEIDEAGSKWTVGTGQKVVVGKYGKGTVGIQEGGLLENGIGYIAEEEDGEGTVTVDGTGSLWKNNLDLFVGFEGDGTLAITGGGRVECWIGRVGYLAGSSGQVTVSGGDATFRSNGNLFVGSEPSGAGVLTVGTGGIADAHGYVVIYSPGTVNLNGGTIKAVGIGLQGGTFNFNYGTLHDTNSHEVTGSDYLSRILGSPAVPFARHFKVDEATTLSTVFTIDGGTFSTGSLVNPGLLQFNRGTFNLTNDDLTIGTGGIFGDRLTVESSKTINVTNNATIDTGGKMELDGGTFSAATLTNHGEIRGDGRVGATLSNATDGVVRATVADYIEFTGGGANTNRGQINLIAGTIQFTSQLTNETDGVISGHGGLIFDGGMINRGTMNFSSDTDIYGDVVNGEPDHVVDYGKIVISGGATVGFHDYVISNGHTFRIRPDAFAIFFGTLSGGGGFSGGGSVWIEGAVSPGNSAAWVQEAVDLTLGSDSDSTMELAGYLALGPDETEYDVIEMTAGYSLVLDGALNIDLLDGFEPATGATFDIYRYAAGDRVGRFNEFNSPTWAGGRHFDIGYGDTAVTLTVVPEPSALVLLVVGAVCLVAIARRKRRA